MLRMLILFVIGKYLKRFGRVYVNGAGSGLMRKKICLGFLVPSPFRNPKRRVTLWKCILERRRIRFDAQENLFRFSCSEYRVYVVCRKLIIKLC